jgi:hypothetical protein
LGGKEDFSSTFHSTIDLEKLSDDEDLVTTSHTDANKVSRKLSPCLIMSDEEDIAALVVDNGSGMCKGELPI